MNKQQTVSLYTQGCRLNISETAVLESRFREKGFLISRDNQDADIIVLNTCTVTENGDKDARRLVNRFSRQNPNVSIALVGCLAQIQKQHLLKWPNVKWVVGNQDKMSLPSLIETKEQGVHVSRITKESFSHGISSVDLTHKRANLKIQDGCDFYCAFCIIPFARGPARSRVFEDIIQDAKQLAEKGHQEIVITGVNLGTYSHDEKTFIDIINEMEGIEGLRRIRISSIEPTTIPDELIEKMASPQSKVCAYLHIPLQSGSDTVLGLMKRKYKMDEYDSFIRKVNHLSPEICIGTDVIVGFPGESDALFNETLDYLTNAPIHYFHVFSYSERQMARSKKMDGQVDKQIISERSRKLREVSQRKRSVFYESMIGKRVPVLFEQQKKGMWIGHTDHYCRVKLVSDLQLENKLIDVELSQLDEDSVLAVLPRD